MRDGLVSDGDAKRADEICRIIESRSKIYGGGVLSTALVRVENGDLVNFFTKVSLTRKGEKAPAKLLLDYGKLVIGLFPLRVGGVTSLMRSLVSQGRFDLPGFEGIPTEGTFVYFGHENNYLQSSDEQFSNEWPANVFIFEGDRKEYPRGGALVANELPLFPDPLDAIRDMLSVDLRRYQGLHNKIVFLAPNHEARIISVNVGKSHMAIRIETLDTDISDVKGKAYVKYASASETIPDFDLHKDVTDIPLKARPSEIWLYLVGRVKGNVLDYRRIRLNWGRPLSQEGVKIEITLDDLRETIQLGENETVEFKLRASGKDTSADEFVESVVSFANGQGGIILVGVDDQRNIVGVDNGQNTRKAIESIVRHKCDPVPSYDIDIRKLDDKAVVLVRIFEGKDKPYLVRGKGPYIRVLSNDYAPLRHELDELTRGQSSNRGGNDSAAI